MENNMNVNTTATAEATVTTEETTFDEAANINAFMNLLAANTAAINELTAVSAKKAHKRSILAKIGIGVGGFALGATASAVAIKTGLI